MTEWGVLEPVADVAEGGWLGKRFDGPMGTVGSVVPRGFQAYARVLHPVDFHDGRPPITWRQVCETTGRIAHPTMQWTSIAQPEGDAEPWSDGSPDVGSLTTDPLSALLDVLAPATGDQPCWHAVWEGWGWVSGSIWITGEQGSRPAEPTLSEETLALPRLGLPFRNYLLFRGPLRAALRIGQQHPPIPFQPQSPSLLWPADRSWCVATEIDFDSTLVGGSREVIDAVLAAPGLESWPIGPGDDLTMYADAVNAAR